MRLILKRLLIAAVQLLAVATIVFAAVHALPGDPVRIAMGGDAGISEEQVQAIRDELGLNDPMSVQYVNYIRGIVHFDFGDSITQREDVSTLIAVRFTKSIELALVALLIAVIIGLVCGTVSALSRGTPLDWLMTGLTVCGISIPVYVIGAVLILIFAINLRVLPASVSTYVAFGEDPTGWLRNILLPALTLAISFAASVARMTRSAMIENLSKDYTQTLRAKGLGEGKIICKHVLRNSLIPIITVVGLQLGSLIGGSVLVENIFNWPGMGKLIMTAVNQRDYALIQGCIVCIAGFFILINMVVDVLYQLLDPKVRK